MIVLGIDPGTATTGYGIVVLQQGKEQMLTYGCIRTSPDFSMPQRLLKLKEELEYLIDKYQPDVAAVEELFHHKNAKTVITVAQARGVIMATAAQRLLNVVEYTPLQVKQSVVGYGKADKKQVQIMVARILGMDKIPRPDDAADALAIAICHLHACKLNCYLLEGKGNK